MIDTVFFLSVLFALDKAGSPFLWGRSQHLRVTAEADGVTRALQEACFLTLKAKLFWLASLKACPMQPLPNVFMVAL